MTPEISIQLYSVREAAEANYEEALKRIADMGYSCVEPAGFPGYSLEKAAQLYKDLGLKVPSLHGFLPIGENKNKIIEDALALGSKCIFTSYGAEDFASTEALKACADKFVEADALASQHGIQVGYHNHSWEMKELEGRPAYEYFLEYTPETVLWEADLFWIAYGGKNPADFVKEIGSRGKILHVKDGRLTAEESDKDIFCASGDGDVDLKSAIRASEHAEVLVVELDSYDGDMMEAVANSYTYLTSQGLGKGTK